MTFAAILAPTKQSLSSLSNDTIGAATKIFSWDLKARKTKIGWGTWRNLSRAPYVGQYLTSHKEKTFIGRSTFNFLRSRV